MVSLVDQDGKLVKDEVESEADTKPVLIRKGLDVDKIMMNLADFYNVWEYHHGAYY